ncbi:hypothetical protein [Pseudarthrobacter cellobiosi]|uniref:hypothetical protein n=1 Tax=Pseudarthrobacter cellobiosi TaxID=2953654 RepID=UPI00208F83A4|nr:hypothetical protein [Pseudarthrobacter sp. HLT1-5]MCO4257340.1 hypothetical protein [Pseudarthrobacter sp. HLT1-5]
MTTTPEAVENSPARSTDELMLDSMGATPNGFEIRTHAGGPETADTLLFIADAMRDALDGHNAPNYLEMEVKASDGKRYIMNLQRAGKLTPHQARVNAEEALEASKPRTITKAEELDALPVGSVVLHNGRAFQHYPAYPAPFDEYQQWKCGDGGFVRSTKDGSSILPATVLHEAAK